MTRDRVVLARSRTEAGIVDPYYYRATVIEVCATLERVFDVVDSAIADGSDPSLTRLRGALAGTPDTPRRWRPAPKGWKP